MYWMLQQLLAPNNQIEACQMNFPDTVFFEEGKPIEIIKTDSETGLLTNVKTENKLLPDQVRN